MLADTYPAESLGELLLAPSAWHPYPRLSDRAAWEGLPAAVRRAHINRAEGLLGYAWPALPATLFLEYARMGNRINYENPHFARREALTNLVLAECMEGTGRFLDDIVNGIWALCEESYWGVPAHIRVQRAGNGLPDTAEPTVDLFAAETGSQLAWIHYLLGEKLDQVSPLVRPRMEREIQTRILTPCLSRDDFGWMGFADGGRRVNNWNPWICSNWLAAVLLVEPDGGRRLAGVAKILHALDNFIDPYPLDGGCDEGPNYWSRAGASLFDNLELLHSASSGRMDLYDRPLIREIARFMYRAHIDGDYYLNFADASAVIYPEALLIFRFGQRIQDPAMMAFGAWLARRQDILSEGMVTGTGRLPPSLGRALPDLFALAELPATPTAPPLLRDVWLPVIQVMAARDEQGTGRGLYLAAKGGHNDESHNHNDVGNFVVYVDGRPLLVDAGVETYTAKTFGPQRYDIWTMQSACHSLLPSVDGVQQAPGPSYRAEAVAYKGDDARARFSLDIAHAYPPEAGIRRWVRTVTLVRGGHVEVTDEYELAGPANAITLSLLTPAQVTPAKPGQIRLASAPFVDGRRSGGGTVTYEGADFTMTHEQVPITDERMGPVWGTSLNRVVLCADRPPVSGRWTFVIEGDPG